VRTEFITQAAVDALFADAASPEANERLARQIAVALASPEPSPEDAARISRVRDAFGDEDLRRWLSAFDGLPHLVGMVYQIGILTQELAEGAAFVKITAQMDVPTATAAAIGPEGYDRLDEYGLRALASNVLYSLHQGDLATSHRLAVDVCDVATEALRRHGSVGAELRGLFIEYRQHLEVDVESAMAELRAARTQAGLA
jgi:hypothetical protein